MNRQCPCHPGKSRVGLQVWTQQRTTACPGGLTRRSRHTSWCSGITYGGACDESNPHSICHVPRPGRSADVWWLGFDCLHFDDLGPRDFSDPEQVNAPYAVYRDFAYVQAECAKLAAQLVDVTE